MTAMLMLRVAARVELISLILLLGNLATVHVAAVATLLGPLHGCAYLVVIGATVAATRPPGSAAGPPGSATGLPGSATGLPGPATRRRGPLLAAVIPGIGGLLAERALRVAGPPRTLAAERAQPTGDPGPAVAGGPGAASGDGAGPEARHTADS